MGRLIVMLLGLIVFLLFILVISKLIPMSGRKLSHEDKKLIFDAELKKKQQRTK